MTQEIKTDKFEGLLVKVPEGQVEIFEYGFSSYHLCITENKDIQLPVGQWKLIGNPFELSDWQWKGIVPTQFTGGAYNYSNYPHLSAGLSLLRSLQVYKENPFKNGEPSTINHEVWYSKQEWQEAEKRTGNWVLIQKIG